MAPQRTIGYYLLRTNMMTVFGVLVSCGVAFLIGDILLITRSMKDRAHAEARIVAANLVSSIVFRDAKDAERLLLSISSDPVVKHAFVFVGGNLFAQFATKETEFQDIRSQDDLCRRLGLECSFSEDRGILFQPLSLKLRQGRYVYFKPIADTSGVLVVEFGIEDIKQQGWIHLFILLLVWLVSVAFAGWMTVLVRRQLSRPFESFVSAIRSTGSQQDGVFDASQFVGKTGVLELERLVQVFDDMLLQLRQKSAIIQDHAKGLEEKVAERTSEIMRMQKELLSAARLSTLGEAAGSIAHEINNPLAIISGKVRILLRRTEKIDENKSLIDDLEKVEKMTQLITKIIKSLKGLSRDGSQDPFEKTKVSVVLDEVMELTAHRMKERNIACTVCTEYDGEFLCRSTQIGQVILNLLNNSLDAIDRLDEKWIRIESSLVKGRVSIRIIDSGTGIPQDILAST